MKISHWQLAQIVMLIVILSLLVFSCSAQAQLRYKFWGSNLLTDTRIDSSFALMGHKDPYRIVPITLFGGHYTSEFVYINGQFWPRSMFRRCYENHQTR